MSKISSALKGKCPACEEGNLFKNKSVFPLSQTNDMVDNCPVCGQQTELEVGFYYGTGYLSYAITVAMLIVSFVLGVLFFGVNFRDNSIYWLLGLDAALIVLMQPFLMRFSRILYLSFFVKKKDNSKA